MNARHSRATAPGAGGFTLIEILIAVAIIGFLSAAVLVAVDPVKRIQDSRDARRTAEANALLNAILTKQVDDVAYYNGETGALVVTHATNAQVIVSSQTGVTCTTPATAPACPTATLDLTGAHTCIADLSGMTTKYIGSIPIDPRGSGVVPTVGNLAFGANNTGYYIHRTANNRIEIGSCYPEQAAAINVKR